MWNALARVRRRVLSPVSIGPRAQFHPASGGHSTPAAVGWPIVLHVQRPGPAPTAQPKAGWGCMANMPGSRSGQLFVCLHAANWRVNDPAPTSPRWFSSSLSVWRLLVHVRYGAPLARQALGWGLPRRNLTTPCCCSLFLWLDTFQATTSFLITAWLLELWITSTNTGVSWSRQRERCPCLHRPATCGLYGYLITAAPRYLPSSPEQGPRLPQTCLPDFRRHNKQWTNKPQANSPTGLHPARAWANLQPLRCRIVHLFWKVVFRPRFTSLFRRCGRRPLKTDGRPQHSPIPRNAALAAVFSPDCDSRFSRAV